MWTWSVSVFSGKYARRARQVIKKIIICYFFKFKTLLLPCLWNLRPNWVFFFIPFRWLHSNDHPPRPWRSCLHGWAASWAEADGGRRTVELCEHHPDRKLAEIVHGRARLHTRICVHLQKAVTWSATERWRHRRRAVTALTDLLYVIVHILDLCMPPSGTCRYMILQPFLKYNSLWCFTVISFVIYSSLQCTLKPFWINIIIT